ncbi:MAG: ATP-binding protein [Anaerostipes sp.]|jgi:ATP-dependent DNA helicase RecG
MKERAMAACKTDEERGLVKDITKGNLLSWGLLTKREDEIFPTNAFVLMTENDFPQARIQCAVFKGNTRSEFIDKREYDGPIYEQIEEAYQFVLRNIHYGATIRGLYRVDSYELPTDCIRELICNAVTHRSYLDEGNIQVALYDDRLEITSPGMLFGGLTIEDIKEGRSKPRNRGIAYAFAAMKIIEKWGTGIPRIIKSCKEFGIREPEFIEMGMDIRVNLYRDQVDVDKTPISADKVPISADKTPISADKSLSVNENKVMEHLQSNQAITNKMVQELCGIKDTASKNLLRKMVEKELLSAVGEKKSREYRLK